MKRLSQMLAPAGVALALATATPAHAQFDLLRQLIPSNPLAGRFAPGGARHGEALGLVVRSASQGDMREALRLADALVADEQAHVPGSPWLRQSAMYAAGLHERSGDPARAIVLYQMVLAMPRPPMSFAPDDFSTRLKIADLRLKTGDARAASQDYQALLAAPESASPMLRPLRSGIYAGLGRAALQLGDDGQAEAMLLLAIADDAAQTQASAVRDSGFAGAMAMMGGVKGRIDETMASLRNQYALTDADGALVAVPGAGAKPAGILDTEGPLFDLAALYYRQRNAAALQWLYSGMFSDYAARTGEVKYAFGAPAQLEKEYARFGAWFAGLGQYAPAGQAFAQAERLNARRLKASAADVPPELLAGSFATRRQLLDLLLSLRLAEHASPVQWRGALGDLLQSKSMQSDFLARRTRAIGLSGDPAITRLAGQMEAIDETGGMAQFARRANLAVELQQKVGKLIPPLQFEEGGHFMDLVQARLGTETLVSISRFTPFDFERQQFGAAHYLGAKMGRDGFQVNDLGAADALDASAVRLRADLARRPATGTVAPVLASARAAYDALLKPLLGARAAKAAYVADLDGPLALVPLEALADAGARYLVDDGEWRYVSSARTLLRDAAGAGTGQAVVLADPDYGPVAAGAGAVPNRSAALRGMRFAPLPQALEEGKAVAAALARGGSGVDLLTGERASMGALARLHGPRYLHIATHGFFVEEAGILRQRATGNDGQQYVTEEYMAGRSSGLALAGANATLASGAGDGLMYAAKLRQIDLAGTELAVLSACDTSLGAVLPGEGVDSLRQALEVAGARSMVTSLWSVPDLETRLLMTDFYDALASGASKSGALRQAKLRVKQRQGHPFYWASFVMTGMR